MDGHIPNYAAASSGGAFRLLRPSLVIAKDAFTQADVR